ncbi:unnamed protein product [Acanthosepion pharaonis]|uniref:Uncharacterized protein n=1 Tax=Acanthosepion pharaonis TaxID=158019 RepID=A0A812CWZ8_ACAPH|nr:unnamed protein product [Sepia pharaonis]
MLLPRVAIGNASLFSSLFIYLYLSSLWPQLMTAPDANVIVTMIQWLLYNLGANTAIVITISYWSFIFFMEHSKFLMTNMSKMKHMLNTVYVVLDIFISATPIRIFHMLFPIMLGSIYAIFNATYFLNDGTILDGRHYAYNVLNWNVPAEAIKSILFLFGSFFFFFSFFFFLFFFITIFHICKSLLFLFDFFFCILLFLFFFSSFLFYFLLFFFSFSFSLYHHFSIL